MNDLMTTEEVAERCRQPQSTVRYWRYQGTGPRSAKVGRRVMYRREEVERWLNDQFEKADREPVAG